ncbi:MAG: response regulator [Planctomycetaceae bacterium]|nr:response regulator [Planctomycetaceae bacterium]
MTTLLVVDDSLMDQRRAGGLLQKHPEWSVYYACNGKEALQKIELHLPDLVLTDMQMPEMGGLELVEMVRKRYPLLPIVLMTAQGSEDIAVSALQAGAANYVPKREMAHELVEVVERVLSASCRERHVARLLTRLVRQELAFELENDLQLIPPLVHHLQQAGVVHRLYTESESVRVGVALEEAMLNAYYHGNLEVSSTLREQDHNSYYDLARERSLAAPYRERRIVVEATFTPTAGVYVIRDEGPGFDPSTLPSAVDAANIERPCGRGLLLMRTFMDEVRFNVIGNEVTMVKRRGSRNEAPEQ